jgi:hypothetical protein
LEIRTVRAYCKSFFFFTFLINHDDNSSSVRQKKKKRERMILVHRGGGGVGADSQITSRPRCLLCVVINDIIIRRFGNPLFSVLAVKSKQQTGLFAGTMHLFVA